MKKLGIIAISFIFLSAMASFFSSCAVEPNTYRVLYTSNDGTGVMDASVVEENVQINLPVNIFTKEGYTFAGWATTSGGGVVYANGASFTMGSSDVNLYAVWSANSHTLSFNATGGTNEMDDITLNTDEVTTLSLNTFTKEGYTFAGWATTSGGDVVYANEASFTMGSSDVNLYAVWSVATYVVKYNANEATSGEVPSNQTKIHRVDLTIASNSESLARTGYTFAGWNTQPDGLGTTYAEGSTYASNAEVLLYANWDYLIGSRGPAGGYIIYDDEIGYDSNGDGMIQSYEKNRFKGDLLGKRYLEAAPSDISVGGSFYHIFGYYRTTSEGSSVLVGTNLGIGKGLANTTALVSKKGSRAYISNYSTTAETTEDYAARVCDTLVEGVYDDWFLPSKDELNLMYVNLKKNNQGDFSDKSYWSSSERNAQLAWYQNFDDGDQFYNDRYGGRWVRPVRAF